MPREHSHYSGQHEHQTKCPIDWGKVDAKTPTILSKDADDFDANENLPAADTVVLTWTSAEWEAMKSVFTYEAYDNYDSKPIDFEMPARVDSIVAELQRCGIKKISAGKV